MNPLDVMILPKRVLVLVTKDMTEETPKVVYEHEIPILEEIHGEGSVKVIDHEKEEEMDIVIHQLKEPIDARNEFTRCVNIYGRHAEIPMSNAEVVYGKGQLKTFAVAAGAREAEEYLAKQKKASNDKDDKKADSGKKSA